MHLRRISIPSFRRRNLVVTHRLNGAAAHSKNGWWSVQAAGRMLSAYPSGRGRGIKCDIILICWQTELCPAILFPVVERCWYFISSLHGLSLAFRDAPVGLCWRLTCTAFVTKCNETALMLDWTNEGIVPCSRPPKAGGGAWLLVLGTIYSVMDTEWALSFLVHDNFHQYVYTAYLLGVGF